MSEKILVIDDHFETLRLTSLILKRKSYTVLTAQSGVRGLELARESKPDLVLLDIMMPEMDGIEVCRQFRADEAFDDVPIMMFTARAQESSREEALEAGASDYVTKPTRPRELLERVGEVLSKPILKASRPTVAQRQVIGLLAVRDNVDTHLIATNIAHAFANLDKQTTLVEQNGVPMFRPKSSLNGFKRQLAFDPESIDANELLVVDLGHALSSGAEAILPHLTHVAVCFSVDLMEIMDAETCLSELGERLPSHVQRCGLLLISAEAEPLPVERVASLLKHPILTTLDLDHNLPQYQHLVSQLLK